MVRLQGSLFKTINTIALGEQNLQNIYAQGHLCKEVFQ
jgi:hypothetical protein